MVTSGNWLDPQQQINTKSASLDSGVRLVKPPLLYWLQATSILVFGATEFAVRLPSALAALAGSGVIYRLGSRTYDRRAGLAGAVLFLVFPGMLLGSHAGRGAVPDATLALFGSLFVWLTWLGRNQPKLLVPAGLAAGLAVMTKGVAAGVFLFAVLPLVASAWRSYYSQWRWAFAGVLSTVVVALPWHLYAWVAHGESFIEQYFLQAVLARVNGNATVVGRPDSAIDGSEAGSDIEPVFEFMNYPYLLKTAELIGPPYEYALPFFLLLFLVAIVLLLWLVRRDGRAQHVDKLALLWWSLSVPVTFAIVGGNQPWYVLPMYVPGAVLLGYVPAALYDGTVGSMIDSTLTRFGLAGNRLGAISPRDRLRDALLQESGDPARVRNALYLVCCLVVALVLVASYAPGPANEFDFEQRDLGQTIASETPEDETIYVWFAGDAWRKSLMSVAFYADRSYERVSLDRLRSEEEIRYAIIPVSEADRLDIDHRVVVNGTENHVLIVRFPRSHQ
jgi:4-amino-4-deoxy-L-arabinose transferase-like glycosyltransferase